MRVRRLFSLRFAVFSAGLGVFAAVGLVALAWAGIRRLPVRSRGRGLARLMAAAGLRLAEEVYPGIVAVSPFGGHYCRVRRVSAPRRVRPNESFDVEVVVENIGDESWQGRGARHPVRLGTWNPPDHSSVFHDPESWIQDNRPGELSAEVPPLETATFSMKFQAPGVAGIHREELAPVAEGLCWFPARPIRIEVEVAGEETGRLSSAFCQPHPG